MCHAAAWIVDHVRKPPHGRTFKKWAKRVQREYNEIEVTTCHDYQIFFKYRYQCTNPNCSKEYGRHSDSIDPNRHGCGVCGSHLRRLGTFNRNGTPAKPRKASAFSLFMKAHFGRMKRENPGLSHKDLMQLVSAAYRASKAQP